MMNDKQLEDAVSMLISHFNMQAGMRYRVQTVATREAMKEVIKAANEDLEDIRGFFKEFAKNNKNISDACGAYIHSKKQGQKPAETPADPQPTKPAETIPQTVETKASWALGLMGQVMLELLAKTKTTDVEAEIGRRLEGRVMQFINDNYGPIQRRVELQFDGRKVELEGVVHNKFEQVLKFVKAGEPVFLTGPAGSGKNVLCQQVAKAMGLSFYFSNAVTQEYKITGFTDAMGVFHESQFYKAFKNGGVFMLDEMDASIPEVLIILNAAIANRYFDFPAPIGYVEAHPDFRVIAAGNTFGSGADYDYVGRNQLDAASLDRFAMVRVDYDQRIEEACALGNSDLLGFCRKFREVTKKAGIRTVVSYRAISRMAKLDSAMEPVELLDSCLVKSLDAGDLDAIKNELDGFGKYSAALKRIAQSRKEV